MREIINIMSNEPRLVIKESLPNNFEFSRWGYWIEPTGQFIPVEPHGHHKVHRMGDHTMADGRIRCTAVTDPTIVKMNNPIKLLAANFYTNYVTKAALGSLIGLISEYEFEEYHIVGMTIEAHQLGNYDRGEPDQYLDPRSVSAASTRSQAMASVRAFLSTAALTTPQQDRKITAPVPPPPYGRPKRQK